MRLALLVLLLAVNGCAAAASVLAPIAQAPAPPQVVVIPLEVSDEQRFCVELRVAVDLRGGWWCGRLREIRDALRLIQRVSDRR